MNYVLNRQLIMKIINKQWLKHGPEWGSLKDKLVQPKIMFGNSF